MRKLCARSLPFPHIAYGCLLSALTLTLNLFKNGSGGSGHFYSNFMQIIFLPRLLPSSVNLKHA